MTRYEKILEVLGNMDTAEIVSIHNAYCEEASYMDDYIYPMDEFNEVMAGSSAWEVARACFYGHEFCPAHDYFFFNGYGNLESFDYWENNEASPICLEAIAEYCDDNEESLMNDDIQDILDEEEEEEEDEE